MKVYRLAGLEEVNIIYRRRRFDNIGRKPVRNSFVSNHNYIVGERYMHFFKNVSGILYFEHEGKYLCTYEIDESILSSYYGIGLYYDVFNHSGRIGVEEYAIPSRLIKYENLVQVSYITSDIPVVNYEEELNHSLVLKYKR